MPDRSPFHPPSDNYWEEVRRARDLRSTHRVFLSILAIMVTGTATAITVGVILDALYRLFVGPFGR
jgi:hypothetical protein